MRLQNRTHFYGACAEAMRRVLVDHARRRNADKRGAGEPRRSADAALDAPIDLRLDLVALDGRSTSWPRSPRTRRASWSCATSAACRSTRRRSS